VNQNTSRPLDAVAALIMLALTLSWGLNQVSVKLALPEIPPFIQATVRSIGAFVVVALWARWRGVSFSLRDGTLAAGIAHEINNPIAVMQGNLEVIRDLMGRNADAAKTEFRLIDEQLERIGELVTKPVDGYGGDPVLIGPAATAAEGDPTVGRRPEVVQREPRVGNAPLSSLPCVEGGHLEPRRVDLRAFVYLTGPERRHARLAPLGLTRVAPPGSLIVNSSRGGGAKDTWIVPRPRDGGQTRVRTGR